jgi:hypothetical protein
MKSMLSEVGEARGGDEERQHVGRLLHVELAHALLEDVDGALVLRLEPLQAARLVLQE